MKPIYTTHLICTPQLETPTTVGTLLVLPGEQVETDTPLVVLHSADKRLEVCAPETGTIGEILVKLHEEVNSGDLLLTMEIEEKPFGFLPMVEEEPAFAPACQLPYAQAPSRLEPVPTTDALLIQPEAARFAARLGVDLAEVPPDADGMVDDEAVASYVRDILVRWRKLRRLLND